MKKIWLILCLFWLLSGSVSADETLRLSQEDAKQLHAFLLTGELLDWRTGKRVSQERLGEEDDKGYDVLA